MVNSTGKIFRTKQADKSNVYVCECGAGLEKRAPSLIKRHEETDKHYNWVIINQAIKDRKNSEDSVETNELPSIVIDTSESFPTVTYEPEETPVKTIIIKKARKDEFYCRKCKQTRRANPVSNLDIMGHPSPTGEIKVEIAKPTVVEVVQRTGLSTNSTEVITALNQLEYEVKERIHSSEKILEQIEEMRKVLGE